MNEVILAEIRLPVVNAVLRMTCCPGKPDTSGTLNSNVIDDLMHMKAWGVDAIVSLVNRYEMALYQLDDLGDQISSQGIQWFHHPFEDGGVPCQEFTTRWQAQRGQILDILKNGGKVIVHCRGGKGRTGLICAQLMLEMGENFDQTVALIQQNRPGALAKQAHLDYLKSIHSQLQGSGSCHA